MLWLAGCPLILVVGRNIVRRIDAHVDGHVTSHRRARPGLVLPVARCGLWLVVVTDGIVVPT